MTREEKRSGFIKHGRQMVMFTRHHQGHIAHRKGWFSSQVSATNNFDKHAYDFVKEGVFVKMDGWFKTAECEAKEFRPHDKKLTDFISSFIANSDNCIVYREKLIKEISLRPDCMLMAFKNNHAALMIAEVIRHERPEYTQMKINALNQFYGLEDYIKTMFGLYIKPSFIKLEE